MRKTLTLAMAVVALLALTVACSTTESPGEQIDDAVIVTKIKSKLAADMDVAATSINVDSEDGVVTLTGTLKSDEARRQAEQIARNTNHVKRVISRLRVEA